MACKSTIFHLLLLAGLLAALSSCNTTRFLNTEQALLTKNAIRLENKSHVEDYRNLSYELTTLYKQKPNGNLFFLFPREWFFFKSDPSDSSRINTWRLRFLAERPAIYDSAIARNTALEMQRYLQYKGYYDAQVSFEAMFSGKNNKKAGVLYDVRTNGLYRIDSIFFSAPSREMDSILQKSAEQTFFKRGAGLDGKLFELEKDRISKTLRNQGFAYFYPTAIPQIEVDTNHQTLASNIYLTIVPSSEQRSAGRFFIGDIVIFPNFNPAIEEGQLRDTIIQGLVFRDTAFHFFIKPEVIRNAVHLRQGMPYQDDLYELTNRQLGSLGVFKFVRVRQEVDSIFPNKLNFRIELTPTPRFEMGLDFELNYTNRSNAAGIGNLIGVSLSPSVRHRNLFKGAEALVSKLSAGVEVNPSPESVSFWNTIDLRFQTDLFWPRFRDYLGIWRQSSSLLSALDRRQGDRTTLLGYMQRSANNRLSASWNYVSLLNFYNYGLVHLGYGFDIQQPNRRFSVNHLGIDYLLPRFQEASSTILNENPFFRNSFSKQLFVSLFFRDLNIVLANRPDKRGFSQYAGLTLETSGFEFWASNSLYNWIANKRDTFTIGNVPFSQYVRVDADYRVYKQMDTKRSFAVRFTAGAVRPLGFSDNVHYVKQFFSGGPNSIRGWAARELGPGGHIDSLSLNYNNPLFYYQTGDLKLEFNLEYRFHVLWALNGALFLDGGNIWTIAKDPTRPGSQFRFTETVDPEAPPGRGLYDPFYRQIALSPGLGVRLDFSYFIFRIDLGVKMRYPYRWDGERFWNPPSRWMRDPNINLGLGLPF